MSELLPNDPSVAEMMLNALISLDTNRQMPREQLVQILHWCVRRLVKVEDHNERLREAIRGITCRLLPNQDAMDMHFARCDIERLEVLTALDVPK